MSSDETGQRYAEYKAGAITLEEYIASLRGRGAFPLTTRVPRGWRELLFKAAGRGAVTVPDIERLQRTFGGTQE
jgi:hypothetical protein